MVGTGFDACLKIVLQHEGGYVNNPNDPGGPTNMGITQKTYEKWVGHPVTAKDIENLTIEDVKPIYKAWYWDTTKADSLPHGVDLQVFDFGVNAGPGRAVRFLQKLVGVPEDGAVGPATLEAVQRKAKENIKGLINDYGDERVAYYKSLKNFDIFGKGWLRRVKETTEAALQMAASG